MGRSWIRMLAMLSIALALPSTPGGQVGALGAEPAAPCAAWMGKLEPLIPLGYYASVALDGSRAVVGSINFGGPRGNVFVFRQQDDQWVEEAILLPDGNPTSDFGRAVDIDGSRIVVGDRASVGDGGVAAPCP